MAPDELLARLAVTLRQEIGPAVADTYPRTQAFMGAVVLEKLSGQLRNAAADAAADHGDRAALARDLADLVTDDDPPAVREAVATLGTDGGPSSVSGLIDALYDEQAALGAERFGQLLGRVRSASRALLDRQLAYAR